MTPDLWRLVVHWQHGDVEEQARHSAALLVADREDEVQLQWVRADVLHRGHEGHLHVVDGLLEDEQGRSGGGDSGGGFQGSETSKGSKGTWVKVFRTATVGSLFIDPAPSVRNRRPASISLETQNGRST